MDFIVNRIEKIVYNGVQKKLVTLYEKGEGVNLFYGKFLVPMKISNKNVASWIENNLI